ncbi:MAG: hypothetical protein Q9227_004138 [Pyrenula ochraceoflavens]
MDNSVPSKIDPSALAEVDQQLAKLEESISKLKGSLRHWQTWEIEYEGLKEEISLLGEDPSSDDMLNCARDFGAETLNDEEIRSVIGEGRQTQQQVVSRLSNRVEYVARNIAIIKRQLSEAQRKRNALLLIEDPEHRNEAALPMTEITEQLDEEGNVVTSSVQTADKSVPQLVDVLQKAGVKDILLSDGVIQSNKEKPGLDPGPTPKAIEDTPDKAIEDVQSQHKASKPPQGTSSHPDINSESSSDSGLSSPKVPSEESPDDAKLRQEMIEYTRGELGAIVAELELEEGDQDNDSDASIHDFMDEEDMQLDDSEDSDGEDEFGRNLKSPLTEAYHQEMVALERKLNAKSLQNLGPDPKGLPQDVHTDLSKPNNESKPLKPEKASPSQHKKTKKVSFAKDLDIAPDAKDSPIAPTLQKASNTKDNLPLSSSILERSGNHSSASLPDRPRPPRDKKQSRFEATRLGSTNTLPDSSDQRAADIENNPTSLAEKIQSDMVIERSSSGSRPKVPTLEELDADLHRKEIAGEYHRMRNRMIARQGGFTDEAELEEEPMWEDEPQKKFCNFKLRQAFSRMAPVTASLPATRICNMEMAAIRGAYPGVDGSPKSSSPTKVSARTNSLS